MPSGAQAPLQQSRSPWGQSPPGPSHESHTLLLVVQKSCEQQSASVLQGIPLLSHAKIPQSPELGSQTLLQQSASLPHADPSEKQAALVFGAHVAVGSQ